MSQAAVNDHHQQYRDQGIHTFQIFFASILTLVAAGIGFSVRGGILGDWGAQFGFTKSELGSITGGGLAGFGFTIIAMSIIADRVGYKAILVGAFLLHALSAVVTLAATPVFDAAGREATYWTLYVGMFMFALGNGLCEAAINPLTATLYPTQKTHYLNILHAGWPAGLVLGAIIAYFFAGETAKIVHLRWEILIATFLVPAVIYGFLVIKNRFPVSETHASGVSLGEQFATVLAPMFIFLIIIHAMVGYVELGTDSWIMNIMNNVVGAWAIVLFIYINLLMTALRFFAGPIVHKINPLGLLFVSACLGAVGLFMLGTFSGMMLIVAGTVFAIGKTFYWPTMLGVAGERFPKSGALGMGLLGGFGMLSAGFLGSPGIGYKQDRNAVAFLKDNPDTVAVYERYKKEGDPNRFLFFQPITGLDGSKVDVVKDGGATLDADIKTLERAGKKLADDKKLSTLHAWWYGPNPEATKAAAKAAEEAAKAGGAASAAAGAAAAATAPAAALPAAGAALGALAYSVHDKPIVLNANTYGGQQALKITAAVPVTMAICYLLLVLYFISKGGYKQIHLEDEDRPDTRPGEKYTGGVEGPVR